MSSTRWLAVPLMFWPVRFCSVCCACARDVSRPRYASRCALRLLLMFALLRLTFVLRFQFAVDVFDVIRLLTLTLLYRLTLMLTSCVFQLKPPHSEFATAIPAPNASPVAKPVAIA